MNKRVPTPKDHESLQGYLSRCGIRYFTAEETLHLLRSGISAPEPPRKMWPNIVPALRIADRIRTEIACPLQIGNGYRPKALNKAAGGARRSKHIQYAAVDLDLYGKYNTPENRRALYEAAGKAYLRYGKEMRMGLGVYRSRSGSRVHIDAGARWRQACWGGPKKRYVKDLLAELV